VATLALAHCSRSSTRSVGRSAGFTCRGRHAYVQQLTLWLAFVGAWPHRPGQAPDTLDVRSSREGLARQLSRLLASPWLAQSSASLRTPAPRSSSPTAFRPTSADRIPEWVSEIVMPVTLAVMALQFAGRRRTAGGVARLAYWSFPGIRDRARPAGGGQSALATDARHPRRGAPGRAGIRRNGGIALVPSSARGLRSRRLGRGLPPDRLADAPAIPLLTRRATCSPKAAPPPVSCGSSGGFRVDARRHRRDGAAVCAVFTTFTAGRA